MPGQNDTLVNAELARVLDISERTLLRLRNATLSSLKSKGTGHLYKVSEVERVLREKLINANPPLLKNFVEPYLFKNEMINKYDNFSLREKGWIFSSTTIPFSFRIGRNFKNPLYEDTNASCNIYFDRKAALIS